MLKTWCYLFLRGAPPRPTGRVCSGTTERTTFRLLASYQTSEFDKRTSYLRCYPATQNIHKQWNKHLYKQWLPQWRTQLHRERYSNVTDSPNSRNVSASFSCSSLHSDSYPCVTPVSFRALFVFLSHSDMGFCCFLAGSIMINLLASVAHVSAGVSRLSLWVYDSPHSPCSDSFNHPECLKMYLLTEKKSGSVPSNVRYPQSWAWRRCVALPPGLKVQKHIREEGKQSPSLLYSLALLMKGGVVYVAMYGTLAWTGRLPDCWPSKLLPKCKG